MKRAIAAGGEGDVENGEEEYIPCLTKCWCVTEREREGLHMVFADEGGPDEAGFESIEDMGRIWEVAGAGHEDWGREAGN